jgi:8-oxo-dGTP pyrophosphatase MutT (NUDIX family)
MAMKHFFVGVKAILRDGDRVLLAKGAADKQRDFWDCPGGRIDDDESIPQTLERELKEELPNLKTYQVGRLLHAERVPVDVEGDVSLTLLFYEVTQPVFDGAPEVSDEHEELRWFSLDEAMEQGSPSIRQAVQAIKTA